MSCTLTDRSRQPRRHDALQRSKLLPVFIRQPRNYLCERLFNPPRETWSNPSECSQQLTRRALCRRQLPVGYMPQNDLAAPMVKSPVRPRCPIHGHHHVLPAESQHVGSCTPVWRDRLTPKGCQRPYCIFLIRRTATVRCFQGSHIYTLVNSYQVIAANKPGQSLPDGHPWSRTSRPRCFWMACAFRPLADRVTEGKNKNKKKKMGKGGLDSRAHSAQHLSSH